MHRLIWLLSCSLIPVSHVFLYPIWINCSLSFIQYLNKAHIYSISLAIMKLPRHFFLVLASMFASTGFLRSYAQFTAEEDPLNMQGSNQDFWLLPDPPGNQVTPTTLSPQPDSKTAFLDDLDMNLPPALHRFFPPNLEEFDPLTGILMWLREPQPPDCDEGKFSFCCNQGPPTGRRTNPIEASSRRRKCSRCMCVVNSKWIFIPYSNRLLFVWEINTGSKTLPGCYFTANQFCCDCKDNVRLVYTSVYPNPCNGLHKKRRRGGKI